MRVPRTTPSILLPMMLLVLVVSSAGWVTLSNADEGDPIVVEDGKTISIEYTLKLDDGTVADSSEGREALQYVQGGDQILPALEEKMAGLAVGEERSVTLTPEQGYGVNDPNLLADVPSEQIPQEARTVGAQLMSQDQSGQQRIVRVHEVKEDVIVVDLNHPLAGETLHFDVKVVGID